MSRLAVYLFALVVAFSIQNASGQEWYKERIEQLNAQKAEITEQEKEALKSEVSYINERLEDGEITTAEANTLKEEAAKKRALNIENRIAIIDNKIALLDRNEGAVLQNENEFTIRDEDDGISITLGDGEPWTIFKSRNRPLKYDRRTNSDFVFAVGLNNALVDGQSLEDSPYKIGGSRFAELGWSWRTRVFKNSNFMRFNYGFSFQFNGLKPKGNQYFEANNGQVSLEEFEFDLKKSKFRMDNLVFPVHLEFGPSKRRETEKTIRYSLRNQFRLGIGGYGGFNLGTRQKLKYNRNGENVKDKLKRGYNTTNFVYGLSAYAGFDGILLYAKYDLNPIFKNADVEQHNISLGLRFDL
ncbi:hypothetical protein [Maribacter halichondriae]|uniref:hypothetical protein n=1 Tax=Maribacter halichondriae TaxID=2980554 RepID=UPI00235971E0|nr:hypothetical protein [Maribacter sp. Hal144]